MRVLVREGSRLSLLWEGSVKEVGLAEWKSDKLMDGKSGELT